MEELDDAASRLATFLDRECPGGGSGRRHAAEHPGRAYYRIWRLGAIVVPINPLMQDREVQFYLSNTGASALFGSPGYETAVTKGAGDDPNYLEEPTEFGSNPMTPPRAPSDLPAPSVVSCLLWVSWCGRRQARGWCVHRDIAHAWSRAHAGPRSSRTSAVLVRRWSHHVDVYVAPPGWNATSTPSAPPALRAVYGVGPDTATTLLTAIGDNPNRICSDAAFAKLCGVCPLEASSGKTIRHRLNRGGNRDANRALHVILVVRMRRHEPTRDYFARPLAEGKTKNEIMRCVKRYIAREIYHALRQPGRRTNELIA